MQTFIIKLDTPKEINAGRLENILAVALEEYAGVDLAPHEISVVKS